MDTCICLSLCFPPETVTTLLIGYTPIQIKSLMKQKKMKKGRSLLDQGILLIKKYKLLNSMGNVFLVF